MTNLRIESRLIIIQGTVCLNCGAVEGKRSAGSYEFSASPLALNAWNENPIYRGRWHDRQNLL